MRCSVVISTILMLVVQASGQTTRPATRPGPGPAGPGDSDAAPPAPGHPDHALETYARGDYAAVVRLLAPLHEAGNASIQQGLLLARSYVHLGRRTDARVALVDVLESDRENPEANELLGRLLQEAGQAEDAVEYLKHAHRLKRSAATA